ncbi:MAG: hypothetical protein CSA09_03265 [Candidatus Contendobacter odensis]|uniref:TonB-dependent receptor-like beta-barrel domain-containing protein n=1 Tax=Candidatus Contendibacter odensensis TaxID=1400860 RepID=A0A2G6PFT1_9GAMM|nr:MAG: hypothetical protein CSA09_03265 [Candidatus Contendobacter odensis]
MHGQSRLDSDARKGPGVDLAAVTDGFSTLDLCGGVQWHGRLGVSVGINNALDCQYAEFLSGGHVEATSSKPV